MLFADFIKRLMPIAQSAPEFRDHFPPASWKQLFDLGTETGDGLLVFEVDDLLLAELGGGRVEDVVVPFVRALNQEFAGDRAPREEEPQAAARFEQDAPSAPRVAASPGPAASSESAVPVEPAAARAGEQAGQRRAAGAAPWAAAPSPETPFATPAPSSEPVPAEPSWSFPEYDYSREDIDPLPNVEVSSVDGGTALRYSWPDPGEQELFRVVVSDHEPPFSPDDAADVGTSETALLRDTTEPATAVRFVTVWGYEVLDHGARELGQPRKVAEGTYVQPVQEWTIEHDREAGMVFSSWRRPVYPSHVTGRVRVAKLPVGEPIGRHLRGQNWLRSSLQLSNSEQGFQDGALRPGETHTYVAGLEVQIEGRTLVSTPKRLQIVPEAEPDRIVDLQVESITRDRQEQLRLTWTQRKGTQVQFCRSTTPARPEAVSRGRITAAQMADAGLPAEQLIRNIPSPTGEVSADGRERWVLEGLDWPRGSAWDTLHLTPITRLGQDEVLIGMPTQLRRAGRIEEVRVVQRMNWQLVTFTWPGEALAVELRVGFPDSEPDLSTAAHAVVEKAAYERSGGFRLDQGLPPQGCRLFLNAVTHFQGRRISSEPTVAAVEPLWGYHYRVDWGVGSTGGGGNLLQRAAARRRKNIAQIEIEAVLGAVPEHEVPTFVLLHRPDRLPMHSSDGTRVTVFSERPDGQAPAQPHDGVPAPVSGRRELWFDEEDMGPGWYRLMVDARPAATVRVDERRTALERYALADPPLTQLDRRG